MSVSISTKFWSTVTVSPAATCHVATVASATDSGNTGTTISITFTEPLSAGALVAAAESSLLFFAEVSSLLLSDAGASPSPSERIAITCSPKTVAPSACDISVITPSDNACTSSTTLSVSISTNT